MATTYLGGKGDRRYFSAALQNVPTKVKPTKNQDNAKLRLNNLCIPTDTMILIEFTMKTVLN